MPDRAGSNLLVDVVNPTHDGLLRSRDGGMQMFGQGRQW